MDVNFGPFQLNFSLKCATFFVGVTGMKFFGYENSTCKTKTFKKKKKKSFEGRKTFDKVKKLIESLVFCFFWGQYCFP
jgi:hypothetical protein